MDDIGDFYVFSSKLLSSTFQAHPVGLNAIDKRDSGIFDQNFLIQGEYNNINFPVVFRHTYGRELYDILDTGWPSLYLISRNFFNSIQDYGFSGWKTFDIKLLDKDDNEVDGYLGLSVTGRCGPIDYNCCEIIEKKLTPNGPITKYYRGLYIGLDQWDGTDFFLPERYFGIIISKKTSEVLLHSAFSNIHLENLKEIEIPEFTFQV